MPTSSGIVTFLFTDIEGSTRLWEQDAARMQPALALHDAIVRRAVEQHRGTIVKVTGDGVHAVFDDPLDALDAALDLQLTLAEPATAEGIPLAVRCGIHMGAGERRDNDFYGRAINRAARIMSAAHGGQVLVSQPVASLVVDRLAAPASLRDLGDVMLRDLERAERIFQLMHPRLRAQFPALHALDGTPNNLPQQLTSFVGRERELADAVARIPQCRLLTLTGPGGIGKTRLALQAAADVMGSFEDGVFFVEFAPVSDPRMVPQTVATVLGVKEEIGHPVIEALAIYTRDRKMLLILDNCEHLVQACAELVNALLRAGSGVHIVATSREPLRVAGENSYPVSALSVPDPAHRDIAGSAVLKFEAVSLFVERASAAQPEFKLGERDAVAIVDICRRLDGIPLAIELAAARVRTMSVARIAERLSDRFRLLAAGDRASLPRQQTLRALIDWSYDLLSEPERGLLRRLAVFAGGFTLDAAEAVGQGDGIAEVDVMNLLGRLIEKSLVAGDAGDAGKERYGLLETVRQYAKERLLESGEEAQAQARHLAYFLAFAQSARPALSGPDQGMWLARLDAERENILSSHSHCDHADGGADAGMQLAIATKHYWFNRGLLALGRRIAVEALSRGGAERGLLRCDVLLGAGQFSLWLGRNDEAEAHLQAALEIAREAGRPEVIAAILQPLGLAALGRGDRVAARESLEEALALARGQNDKRELAAALNQVAQVDRVDGRTAEAAARFEEALSLAREIDDVTIVAVTLLNLAMVAVICNAPDDVAQPLLETLAIAEKTGDRLAGQSALDVCTGLAALRHDYVQAARFHAMADAQLRQSGMQRDPVDSAFLAPWVEDAKRELGPIAFTDAQAIARKLTYADAVSEAQRWLDRR